MADRLSQAAGTGAARALNANCDVSEVETTHVRPASSISLSIPDDFSILKLKKFNPVADNGVTGVFFVPCDILDKMQKINCISR